MAIPNLFNPYYSPDQVQHGFDQAGETARPAIQQRLGFEEQQRQNALPAAGIRPDMGNDVLRRARAFLVGAEAVQGGMDPAEASMRARMASEGHIPIEQMHAGLDPSHPMSQAVARHTYKYGGPLSGQQTAADFVDQPSSGNAMPQPNGAPQPSIGQTNPPQQNTPPITNGEMALAEKIGLRGETPFERAQRQWYEQQLKNQGQLGVQQERNIGGETRANISAGARKEAAQTAAGARVRSAQIGAGASTQNARTRAQASVDVANIRAEAQKLVASNRNSQDPRIKQLGQWLGVVDASIKNPAGNASPGAQEQLDRANGEINRLMEDLKAKPPSTGTSSTVNYTTTRPRTFMLNGKLFQLAPDGQNLVPLQ